METFEVFVRTPFGKYRGTLNLKREDSSVSGTISFFLFSSDFFGTVSGDAISFSGCMETSIGNIDYEANATVADGCIQGTARTRLGTMTFSSKEGK